MYLIPLIAAMPGFVQFFVKGGFFMAVLLILSIFSLAVILQRALVIKMDRALPPDVIRALDGFKAGSQTENLQKFLLREPSPLSRVLLSVLQHRDWTRAEILDAVQTRARHEISRLESGLVLSLIHISEPTRPY